jgi:UDP-N-acetylmuramoylalanine--D-glutamate ligase
MAEKKKALVIGLGRSGFAAARLVAGEMDVTAWDSKEEGKFKAEDLEALRALGVKLVFGEAPKAAGFDMLIMSPGVRLDIPVVKEAKELGIEITGELELAYTHCRGRFVAITGTNGKTTTTALVGEMAKAAGIDCRVVGNIGLPATAEAKNASEDTIMVTEVSSFQLETAKTFKPVVSAILNITPDHLERHGSFEEYARIKGLVFANQDSSGYYVYNLDDPETVKITPKNGPVCVPFSRLKELDFGASVRDGYITICDVNEAVKLVRPEELRIPGKHNLENALAAAAIGYFAGVPAEALRKALRDFPGVEHRIEFIREFKGVRYVNDSKGTNPDASIKAIEATDTPIILIAGGYEKNSDFTEFIQRFDGKVKDIMLLGVTAERFAKRAIELGFPKEHLHFCQSMAECVELGSRLAVAGDTVLLSPASASWGMYNNYEERGDDFRRLAMELK